MSRFCGKLGADQIPALTDKHEFIGPFSLLLKGCVRYIFASLFFKSK